MANAPLLSRAPERVGKSIIAYDLLWRLRDGQSTTEVSSEAWFNFDSPFPYNCIQPSEVRLVGPGEALIFNQQVSIEILLSAVLFDEGSATGPDERGWISRWSAYLDARRTSIA